MHRLLLPSPALLVLLVVGCNLSGRKKQPEPPPTSTAARGTTAAPKSLAINDRPLSPARQADMTDDRELLIPQPPKLAELTRPSTEPADRAVTQANHNEPIVNPPAKMEKDEDLAAMKRIQQAAAEAYAKLDVFDARLTRRESINGKPNPQEIIRFKFRQQPYSVHLTWIGGDPSAIGREMIFVQGQHSNKMHIKPTKADAAPLPPLRLSFPPDDSMVRSKSRHDIREAGMAMGIKHLAELLPAIDKNASLRTRLKYLGAIQRAEYVSKMEAIEETIPPKTEKLAPQGAKRTYFFDTTPNAISTGLPVLVVMFDNTGKEVEYYCFDRFQSAVRFTDADFDPDKVWSRK